MKWIGLDSFRCYQNLEMEFRAGVNLLIGDNASGKTSILMACKYVLGAFFMGFSDENTRAMYPSEGDFTQLMLSDGMLVPERPVSIKFRPSLEHFAELPSDKSLQRVALEGCYEIKKTSKKNSKPLLKGLKGLRNYAKMLQNVYVIYDANKKEQVQMLELPLFVSFSTDDIHSVRKISATKFTSYYHKRSFGYYEALTADGLFQYWLRRLLVLTEGNKNMDEIAIVERAIEDALGNEGCGIIDSMDVRPQQGKIYYTLTDGREVEMSALSDGYKRLVSIVTDIAFRAALLNKSIYGKEAAKQTKGTVLIDEIDMHLHPHLQAGVLAGLQRAFPSLQFIVSTHAPMVMAHFKTDDRNVVYSLNYEPENGYSYTMCDTYGMDVSSITEFILEQAPRVADVQRQLDSLFDLIDEDKLQEAKELLREMKLGYGERIPELAKAQVMLDFYSEE